jgi:hypothetical protein
LWFVTGFFWPYHGYWRQFKITVITGNAFEVLTELLIDFPDDTDADFDDNGIINDACQVIYYDYDTVIETMN